MISEPTESQPELYVVVADADVQRFVERVLRRGIERHCLRPVRWVARRDPMRDAGVVNAPLRSVPDLQPGRGKLLILLDRHGSGREESAPSRIEAEVTERLVQAGFSAHDTMCIVLDPELEAVLVPVWERVTELVAKKRAQSAPSRAQVLARGSAADTISADDAAWHAHLEAKPKECFLGLLRSLSLRHQPALYDEIAASVSLQSLKESSAGRRLGGQLVEWFGPAAR